jgi:hypothetical protein
MSEGFGRGLKLLPNVVKAEGEEPLFRAEPDHARAGLNAIEG